MTLQQGKYRQIRRMCELVGMQVTSLQRVGVGDLTLSGLGLLHKPGQWRVLSAAELSLLLVGGTGGAGGAGGGVLGK